MYFETLWRPLGMLSLSSLFCRSRLTERRDRLRRPRVDQGLVPVGELNADLARGAPAGGPERGVLDEGRAIHRGARRAPAADGARLLVGQVVDEEVQVEVAVFDAEAQVDVLLLRHRAGV